MQDQRRIQTKLSLRLKIALVTGFALLVMGSVLGLVSTRSTRTILEGEIQKRVRALAVLVAQNASYAMFSNDTRSVRDFTTAMLQQADVAYVFFVAKNGSLVGGASFPSDANAPTPAPSSQPSGSTAGDEFVGPVELKAKFGPYRTGFDNNAKTVGSRTLSHPEYGQILDVTAPMTYTRDNTGLTGFDDEKDNTVKEERVGHVQVGFYLKTTENEIRRATLSSVLIVLVMLAGALAAVVFFVRFAIQPIERMAQAAIQIASGDLRQEVSIISQDEVGQLGVAFNDMLKSIRGMLGQMREASESVEASTNEILSAATQQSAGASEQAASISQTGATVKEINQTAAQTAEKANSVIDIAQRSEEISVVGQKAVEESIAGIEELRGQVEAIAENIIELSERTQQIGEIITTVNDLAEQSNLLALNASIEAAKAGEQGKGFAVVAVEMRNLAEQSKQATAQVRTILSDIQRATRAAVAVTEEGSRKAETSVELANSSGENIRRLAEVIKESSLAAKQIAALANQQSVGIEQISAAMTNIKHSTSEAVAGTKQIERALQDLKSLSDRLSSIVNRYEM
jgi:methyl-accepting chemotaxis protein